ncbi:unnamed protein product, partial [Closterium sp. NIES-54]
RLQVRERFRTDLPILRLHSDRGGEFPSDLLRDFCRRGDHPVGPAPSGVSWVEPLPGTAPEEVAIGSGAAPCVASGGAEPGGAESEGAGSGGAEPWGAEPSGAEPAGVEPGGTMSGGAESRRTASSGGPAVRDSTAGDTGAGVAGVAVGAGGTAGAAAIGPGGARTGGTGAAGIGSVKGAGARDPTEPGAAGVRGARAVLGVPSSTGLTPPLLCPPPDQSKLPLQLASSLPAPSPYTEHNGDLTERREPASRSASPVPTGCRVPRLRPPPVPGTHAMTLRPSSLPLCVPLPPPPESSLPTVPDPESDRARAASPTVSRLLATVVTEPSFESTAASALVAELVDFAAACRLDYATALVAESESARRSAPREWHDTLRTTLAALGFTPSIAVPSLFLRTDTSLPPFYILVYIDDLVFATADTEALTLVKSELQKRHTCTDLGELRSYLGLQNTPDRARRTITLTQSHMVHQVLQCFSF